MIYGYTVKANGVYYPAGVDVPEFDVEKKAEVKKEASALLDEEEVVPKRKAGRPPKKEQ